MRTRAATICLAALLALTGPAAAQEPVPDSEMSEGMDLLGRGAQMLLRGLLSEMEPALQDMGKSLAELEPLLRDLAGKMGAVADYEMPEVLPNGDILIRRKPQAPAAVDPEAGIDL